MSLSKELESVKELHDKHNDATARVLAQQPSPLFVSDDDDSSVMSLLVRSTVLADLSEENYVAGENQSLQPMYCELALSSSEHKTLATILARYQRLSSGLKVFIIRKTNSNFPMSVSAKMFMTLVSSIDIPKQFWDFLLYMGEKEHEVELSPPPVVCRHFGKAESTDARWQFMGCIRLVEPGRRPTAAQPSGRWSLRQSAFYCCYQPDQGRTTWILIAPAEASLKRSTHLWTCAQHPAMLIPFRILFTWYDYAVSNWRPYAVALAQEVEVHEANSLGATPDDTGPVPMMRAGQRQSLTVLDLKLAAARLALQSMLADVSTLANACEDSMLLGDSTLGDELRRLADAFRESGRDLTRNIMRIEHLQERLRSVTALVSTFLELNSAHILQQLGKQSQVESEAMRKLAERSAQDSAKITVLTILTLTYLPLTVVSNFFSTSFVGTHADHIFITKDWWLLVVTSLPLTLLTFYVWRVWSGIKASDEYPVWWPQSRRAKRQHLE